MEFCKEKFAMPIMRSGKRDMTEEYNHQTKKNIRMFGRKSNLQKPRNTKRKHHYKSENERKKNKKSLIREWGYYSKPNNMASKG